MLGQVANLHRRRAVADLGIFGGGDGWMASAGARAYMGVWGLCPQWGPWATPLVGGRGFRPPEANDFFTLAGEIKRKNCSIFSIVDAMNKAKMCTGTLLNYADRLDKFVKSHAEIQLSV